MTDIGASESYWMATAAATTYPSLAGGDQVAVDVAVIGGGIAGICAAWELARTGRSVALLEADRIVAGVTGYTTAKLTAQHTLIYARLRSSLGADAARLYARSQQDAIDHVERTVAELGIDCDLERVAAFTYVLDAGQVDDIRAEVQAAGEAGLAASFVTQTGLPYPIAGAIRVEGQAQFHPRRYLLALADDFVRAGGRIFERTRVVDLDAGEPCRLTTEAGASVVARDVVVATQYPVFDRTMLFTRLVPRRELVVAAVIPQAQDPDGMYITPAERTRSVRTAPYHDHETGPHGGPGGGPGGDGRRLLIVTGETYKPGTVDAAERLERLADWTRQRFGVHHLSYHWAAQDNATTDQVPYIGRVHVGGGHLFVATGFGGWGMSNGVLAGRLFAALIDRQEPAWAGLYDPRRLHPTVEAAALLKGNLAVVRHFVGDRVRTAHADSVTDLDPGDGAVVRIGGQRCAVYRDEGGGLHAVSATCTHLGCVVAFNSIDRTWDCPCHGSRFATDGTVINGPARNPLASRDVSDEPR